MTTIITTSLVKQLRERTGAGMMECKKALTEAGGDLEAAVTLLRKSGQVKAAKKAGRIAAEGVIKIKISDNKKTAIMIEINSETDFVARDKSFLDFADFVATAALKANISNLESLLNLSLNTGKTVNEAREELITKIGENISIGRIETLSISDHGMVGSYIHGEGRIGVVVAISAENPELIKDIAMHIAAVKPMAISEKNLPVDLIEHEKEIYKAQIVDTKKPPEILEKILSGRIQKFIDEITLVNQPFIKNPDTTIGQMLNQAKAEVLNFVRFEVGESVEKKETNFADEVMAQVGGRN
jgi:elongation factor Ts